MIALERAGISVKNYYASEIKKHAIKVSKHNYPSIKHIGDVTKVSYCDGVLATEFGDIEVGKIDLLIGGSPCQNFSSSRAMSTAGVGDYGLEGEKSKLFYEFLRIKDEVKPRNFMLENVKMRENSKEQLDSYLGVSGMYINSELVSFARRPRYYWTDIEGVSVPKDRCISFQDYKESGDLSKYKLKATPSRIRMWSNGESGNNTRSCANVTNSEKIYCLTTKQDRCPNSGLVEYEDFARYLTQGELEAAQTVPNGYTDCLSYNQACDVLGDGWTVDVIAHIFSYLKEKHATT